MVACACGPVPYRADRTVTSRQRRSIDPPLRVAGQQFRREPVVRPPALGRKAHTEGMSSDDLFSEGVGESDPTSPPTASRWFWSRRGRSTPGPRDATSVRVAERRGVSWSALAGSKDLCVLPA